MNTELLTALEKKINVQPEVLIAGFAERRIIPILGEIDSKGMQKVYELLVQLDAQEKKMITLLISSKGGDVDAGEELIGGMSCLRSPVRGIVTDYAFSMAIDILLACDERLALRTSKFLIHSRKSNMCFKHNTDIISRNDLELIVNRILKGKEVQEEFYTRRMGVSVEKVRELMHLGDIYQCSIRPREAKECGIIHEIITDFKFFETVGAKPPQ